MARPPKTSPTAAPVASAACRTSARRVSTSSRATAGQASHRKRRVARCRARSAAGVPERPAPSTAGPSTRGRKAKPPTRTATHR